MKKLIFILALGLSSVTFAKDKKAETNVSNYSLVVKNDLGNVLNVRQFDSEEELLRYCHTRIERWYQYSYTDMMTGAPMDVYEIHEITTCYTVN